MRARNCFSYISQNIIIIKIKVVDLSKITVVSEFKYMNAGNLYHVRYEIDISETKEGNI
jgi:hypothetical protein